MFSKVVVRIFVALCVLCWWSRHLCYSLPSRMSATMESVLEGFTNPPSILDIGDQVLYMGLDAVLLLGVKNKNDSSVSFVVPHVDFGTFQYAVWMREKSQVWVIGRWRTMSESALIAICLPGLVICNSTVPLSLGTLLPQKLCKVSENLVVVQSYSTSLSAVSLDSDNSWMLSNLQIPQNRSLTYQSSDIACDASTGVLVALISAPSSSITLWVFQIATMSSPGNVISYAKSNATSFSFPCCPAFRQIPALVFSTRTSTDVQFTILNTKSSFLYTVNINVPLDPLDQTVRWNFSSPSAHSLDIGRSIDKLISLQVVSQDSLSSFLYYVASFNSSNFNVERLNLQPPYQREVLASFCSSCAYCATIDWGSPAWQLFSSVGYYDQFQASMIFHFLVRTGCGPSPRGLFDYRISMLTNNVSVSNSSLPMLSFGLVSFFYLPDSQVFHFSAPSMYQRNGVLRDDVIVSMDSVFDGCQPALPLNTVLNPDPQGPNSAVYSFKPIRVAGNADPRIAFSFAVYQNGSAMLVQYSGSASPMASVGMPQYNVSSGELSYGSSSLGPTPFFPLGTALSKQSYVICQDSAHGVMIGWVPKSATTGQPAYVYFESASSSWSVHPAPSLQFQFRSCLVNPASESVFFSRNLCVSDLITGDCTVFLSADVVEVSYRRGSPFFMKVVRSCLLPSGVQDVRFMLLDPLLGDRLHYVTYGSVVTIGSVLLSTFSNTLISPFQLVSVDNGYASSASIDPVSSTMYIGTSCGDAASSGCAIRLNTTVIRVGLLDGQYALLPSLILATGSPMGVLTVLQAADPSFVVIIASEFDVANNAFLHVFYAASGCSAGHRADLANSLCAECTSGTFSRGYGTYKCDVCSSGYFAATSAASSCLPCSPGTFAFANMSSACVSCQPGAFASGVGNAVCSVCPSGTYASSYGSSVCSACPPGFFCPPFAPVPFPLWVADLPVHTDGTPGFALGSAGGGGSFDSSITGSQLLLYGLLSVACLMILLSVCVLVLRSCGSQSLHAKFTAWLRDIDFAFPRSHLLRPVHLPGSKKTVLGGVFSIGFAIALPVVITSFTDGYVNGNSLAVVALRSSTGVLEQPMSFSLLFAMYGFSGNCSAAEIELDYDSHLLSGRFTYSYKSVSVDFGWTQPVPSCFVTLNFDLPTTPVNKFLIQLSIKTFNGSHLTGFNGIEVNATSSPFRGHDLTSSGRFFSRNSSVKSATVDCSMNPLEYLNAHGTSTIVEDRGLAVVVTVSNVVRSPMTQPVSFTDPSLLSPVVIQCIFQVSPTVQSITSFSRISLLQLFSQLLGSSSGLWAVFSVAIVIIERLHLFIDRRNAARNAARNGPVSPDPGIRMEPQYYEAQNVEELDGGVRRRKTRNADLEMSLIPRGSNSESSSTLLSSESGPSGGNTLSKMSQSEMQALRKHLSPDEIRLFASLIRYLRSETSLQTLDLPSHQTETEFGESKCPL
eukprot:ANDGO_00420.mRNA.1 hypothetical protein